MIDGSGSFDPDVDPSEDQGLTYKWYCQQKNNNETIDLTKKNTIRNITMPKRSLTNGSDFTGCFGNGYGLLAEPSE